MNRKYCPLLRSRLDWLSRMLYCSGVWSYVINALTTPIFMAVPIITIWVGASSPKCNSTSTLAPSPLWKCLSSTEHPALPLHNPQYGDELCSVQFGVVVPQACSQWW